MTKAPQKQPSWMPTPKQAAVLEAAQEAGLNRTITAICDTAGVTRKSFYQWLKDEDFQTAWRSVWQDALGRHLPGVVAAQVAKALEGDTPAARLVADLAGVTLNRQRIEAETKQLVEVYDARDTSQLEEYLPAVAEIVSYRQRQEWEGLLASRSDVATAVREWLGAENLDAFRAQLGSDNPESMDGLLATVAIVLRQQAEGKQSSGESEVEP